MTGVHLIMEYISVLLYDLPEAIKGFTVYYFDDDGMAYYTMFINAKLNVESQCSVYDHEMQHINNNDFNSMYSADNLEMLRHVV